jgi:hypothetical protein
MTDPDLLSEKGLSVNLPDKPPFYVKVYFLFYYFINLFLFQNCWKRKKVEKWRWPSSGRTPESSHIKWFWIALMLHCVPGVRRNDGTSHLNRAWGKFLRPGPRHQPHRCGGP